MMAPCQRWQAALWVAAIGSLAWASIALGTEAAASGVRGHVSSSPTCPVERVPREPNCAPRGFVAHLLIYRDADRRLVKRATTAKDGRFRVQLRPGRYWLAARPISGASLPRCDEPARVTVQAGRYASIRINCDSGMR
jgi:hypothetical protein